MAWSFRASSLLVRSIVFDRFTDRARESLRLAAQEAASRGDHQVGTGHLLVGILRDGTTPAAVALRSLGVTLDAARRHHHDSDYADPSQPPDTRALAFSPEAKQVLVSALQACLGRGAGAVDTGDLVAGIVSENRGTGAQILIRLGVDYSKLGPEIEKLRSSCSGLTGIGPARRAIALRCRHCGDRKLFEATSADASVLRHPDTGMEVTLPAEIAWRCDGCGKEHLYTVTRPSRSA